MEIIHWALIIDTSFNWTCSFLFCYHVCRQCEICGETAKNVKGGGDNRLTEECNETRSAVSATNFSARSGVYLRGQPFCNFLMACLVIAFVLPWFFRVNVFWLKRAKFKIIFSASLISLDCVDFEGCCRILEATLCSVWIFNLSGDFEGGMNRGVEELVIFKGRR